MMKSKKNLINAIHELIKRKIQIPNTNGNYLEVSQKIKILLEEHLDLKINNEMLSLIELTVLKMPIR